MAGSTKAGRLGDTSAPDARLDRFRRTSASPHTAGAAFPACAGRRLALLAGIRSALPTAGAGRDRRRPTGPDALARALRLDADATAHLRGCRPARAAPADQSDADRRHHAEPGSRAAEGLRQLNPPGDAGT